MKIFLTLFFVVNLSLKCHAVNYWNISSSPTTKDLRKCFFINSGTGWISGDSGIILRTTNSGNNWIIQTTNISKEIHANFFLNERLGWALSWQLDFDSTAYPGTIILKTTNGGNNWTANLFKDTNYYFSSVYFLDSLRGFLGGVPKLILYTSDGGNTWNEIDSDSISTQGFPIKKISFLNNNTGFACGGLMDFGGLVWKTTNSGLNWKAFPIGPDAITDISVFSADTLFATSGDFKFGANFYKSVNGGINWTNYSLDYFGIVTSIDFRTKNEGWMTIGYQQKFFLTTDRGNNWTMLDPPSNSSIFDFCFPDSLNGWAVGAEGRILKYNYLVNVHENEIALDKQFRLHQNYPNPFNPITNLGYGIRNLGFVTLKTYNIEGKEVAVLINEKKSPGQYNVKFDGTNFPSGIYFYRLEVDGKIIDTKRMVLLK